MFPTALLLSALVLGADEKGKAPYSEITIDKLKIENGQFGKPTEITTTPALEKLVTDEASRAAVAKAVDFKTHRIVIFAWSGSGQDKIDVAVQESLPEQLVFMRIPGRTKDLRTHVKVFVVRNDVKYTVK